MNLESLTEREFAKSDNVIIDEVQRVPEILSQIQVEADARKRNGRFILTGSQNFSLMHDISQSLAGRTALCTLLPFSLSCRTARRQRIAKSKWVLVTLPHWQDIPAIHGRGCVLRLL